MRKDTLDVHKYPQVYQQFLDEEMHLAERFVRGRNNKILDVGCGAGRAIPTIAPIVESYTGIDIDKEYLAKAAEVVVRYRNASVRYANAEELDGIFRHNQFDRAIALWNTVAGMQNDAMCLQQVSAVTKGGFFFTVPAKGSLPVRRKYYESLGIPFTVDENETIHSDQWGSIRTYSEDDVRNLARSSGLRIFYMNNIMSVAHGVYVIR